MPSTGEWLVVFLRGLGQIMLQRSALTGLFFLLGLLASSPLMAVAGLGGALCGLLTAGLLRCPGHEMADGLYGFNGALVGIALLAFYAPGVMVAALVVAGAALSTLLMLAMSRGLPGLPPYTAPFVLSAWAMLAAAGALDLPGAMSGSLPEAGTTGTVLRGIGQVMFQGSALAGLFFLMGLLLHSRRAAFWAVAASLLGLACARVFGWPPALAHAGIFGFNAVLAAIALDGWQGSRLLLPVAGIVLATLLLRVFQLTALPALTAPFVLASWLLIIAAKLYRGALAEKT